MRMKSRNLLDDRQQNGGSRSMYINTSLIPQNYSGCMNMSILYLDKIRKKRVTKIFSCYFSDSDCPEINHDSTEL